MRVLRLSELRVRVVLDERGMPDERELPEVRDDGAGRESLRERVRGV